MAQHLRIGVLTVSDRASAGTYADRSGPAVVEILTDRLASTWTPVTRLVPDDRTAIEAALVDLVDEVGCRAVFTTGGTGPALRDVTPEATETVSDRIMPGFGELMRQVSQRSTPTAIMSRQLAALRGHSLIVNLPGSPGAIAECVDAVLPAVRGCVQLLGGPTVELRTPARATGTDE